MLPSFILAACLPGRQAKSWAYHELFLDGWTVELEADFERKPLWPLVEKELRKQFYQINRVVADGPLKKLHSIKVYVHEADAPTPCMAYHPAPEWLAEHGSDPKMAKGIEVAHADAFLSWTYEQPWMVLHELSHGFHDQFLDGGFEDRAVKDRYEAAMKEKKYDRVLHWDGKTVKHYAETNQMEFFAEMTEAYFGLNDFYPFNRAELMTCDPETFKLMQSVWGDPVKRTTPSSVPGS